ncbi:MAG: hypothetical protein FWG11_01380 [Promicromonosporaceae bacterium]|nr:hypothetical protein [Promicromonosporaceae bacterium]
MQPFDSPLAALLGTALYISSLLPAGLAPTTALPHPVSGVAGPVGVSSAGKPAAEADDTTHSGSAGDGSFDVESRSGPGAPADHSRRRAPGQRRHLVTTPEAVCEALGESNALEVWQTERCRAAHRAAVAPACELGEYAVSPLWSLASRDGVITARLLRAAGCRPSGGLETAAVRAWASLPLASPTAEVQTGAIAELLLNTYYPVYVEAAPQLQEFIGLGTRVTIRATPVEYEWDFGDGTRLRTGDPGRRWVPGQPLPDASWVGHTWTKVGSDGGFEDVEVRLTTFWSGDYSVAGGAWIAIDPLVATTSSVGSFTLTEALSRLICDPAC